MLKKRKVRIVLFSSLGLTILLAGFTVVRNYGVLCDEQMIDFLKELNQRNHTPSNSFAPEAGIAKVDSQLKEPGNENNIPLLESKAALALKVGKEEESVKTYQYLIPKMSFMDDADGIMPS